MLRGHFCWDAVGMEHPCMSWRVLFFVATAINIHTCLAYRQENALRKAKLIGNVYSGCPAYRLELELVLEKRLQDVFSILDRNIVLLQA